jgi:hypothetical protein
MRNRFEPVLPRIRRVRAELSALQSRDCHYEFVPTDGRLAVKINSGFPPEVHDGTMLYLEVRLIRIGLP